tara:strand:+ start:2394 stop:4295 length:1902 start_codon:yes stop_codon:yes gene_type:complete
MALNVRTKKSNAGHGKNTPFNQLEHPLAIAVTQGLKKYEGSLGDSLIDALNDIPNGVVALDNGTPVLIAEGDSTNYSTSLNGPFSKAIVAKAARKSGLIGLTMKDIDRALDIVSLEASLEAQEVDVNLYNAHLHADDPSQGVVISTNSSDGRSMLLADGKVTMTGKHTGITFRYAPNNGGLQYTEDRDDEEVATKLQKLFSNINYEQFVSIMAYAGFILAHPRVNGLTYPILYLHGNAGSGKTTVARLVAMLLGLGETKVKTQPKDVRDLIATAAHNYMLCFDNCGRLSDELANAMCSVATGGTVDGRKLYTNIDLVETLLHQPMILTAIKFAKQYDLCTRAVFIKADKPRIKYASDTEIFQKLNAMLPEAQSWLLSTTAKAMTLMGEVEPIAKYRGGDYNTWLAAFEKALGVDDQSVQKCVNQAQDEALNMQALEHDELLASIITVVQQQKYFVGGPTQVHKMLHSSILNEMRRLPRNWPQNASALTNKLNRMKEQLLKHGVEVISGGTRGTNGRKLTLRAVDAAEVVAVPETALELPGTIVSTSSMDIVPSVESAEPMVMVEPAQENYYVEELPESDEDEQQREVEVFNDEEMDALMEQYDEVSSFMNTAPDDWSQMSQEETDAATADFLG